MTVEEAIPLIKGWPFVTIHRSLSNIVTGYDIDARVEKVICTCSSEQEASKLASELREHREILFRLRGDI